MSLEQAVKENTAAVVSLTAALLASFNKAAEKAPQASKPVAPKADKEPDTKPAAPETPKAETPAAETPAELTYADVGARIVEIVKDPKRGPVKVKAVLAKFGIKRGPEAKPEQWADLLAALNAIPADA